MKFSPPITMSTLLPPNVGDIEQGIPRRRSSAAADSDDDDSVRCSDDDEEEEDEERLSSSCPRVIVVGVLQEEEQQQQQQQGVVEGGQKRRSCSSSASSCCLSECSVEDLESGGGGVGGGGGGAEAKVSVHLSKVERDCRICHLSLDGSNPESGFPIELGCSCKDDLAAAHKHCAEAWFKIRGNKTCEICGSTARNVVGVNEVELMEQWNEANDATSNPAPPHPAETRHFWQGHRFLNFLLACMVFAFVISWLFHFNVPS